MDAIVAKSHGDASVLSLEERPEPTPDRNEVKIEVEAAGINFADIEKRRGDYPDNPDLNTPDAPFVPGQEAAGRVVETGVDTAFSVGDRVMTLLSPGSYAEFTTADERKVFPIPDGVSFQRAAGVPVQFFTAHNTLFEWGDLTPGETVLIHAGAGGVGSAAIQLCSGMDVTVYTTASTEHKLAFTRDLGADNAVNYTERSVQSVAEEELADGFDLVLDGVGGQVFKESVETLAPGGRIITYGLASGKSPIVAAPRLLFENRSVIGYHLEHAFANIPERVLTARDPVVSALADGDVDVQINRTFPLAEADDAHRHIESRSSIGKVVLDV